MTLLTRDTVSENVKTRVRQIQGITLTSQDTIRELRDRQQDLSHEFRHLKQHAQQSLEQTQQYIKQRESYTDTSLVQMHVEQRQKFASLEASFATTLQPLLAQMEQMTLAMNQPNQMHQISTGNAHSTFYDPGRSRNSSTVRISGTIASHQCPSGCRCQCHTRTAIHTPPWLRSVFGQLLWSYNSSVSMRSCNYSSCQESLGKYHFTYYFPPWLVSRAIVASANLEDILGAGAKISTNVPLVIPEENHIVWSLVIAGNLEQLRQLLSHDKNLMHVRNQWGQSLMHVAAKIHQPAVFNFLISIGIDEHLPDENQKTAATTVLTRRGSQEYALSIDMDDLANRLDWTPLHKAAALTREGRQVNQGLLQSCYDDINSRDALGRTPLHWLAENGEADAIRFLTRNPWKANVHARDSCGFTALHCACWADSLDSAAALLDAGSNANARDKHERTPLLHFDNSELLDLMIAKGADVYISDDEGANIMHHAAVADQAALAKTLLEQYGHTICVTNGNGDMPLGLAIQNNSLNFMAVLLPFLEEFPVEKLGMPNQNKRNVLHLAALHASTEALNMLTTANMVGVDVVARDKDGHSPNECFLKCRSTHCAVAAKPFDTERRAWVELMESARRQGEDLVEVGHEDEKTEAIFKQIHENDSGFFSDTSSDDLSGEEFVDAYDSHEKID